MLLALTEKIMVKSVWDLTPTRHTGTAPGLVSGGILLLPVTDTRSRSAYDRPVILASPGKSLHERDRRAGILNKLHIERTALVQRESSDLLQPCTDIILRCALNCEPDTRYSSKCLTGGCRV